VDQVQSDMNAFDASPVRNDSAGNLYDISNAASSLNELNPYNIEFSSLDFDVHSSRAFDPSYPVSSSDETPGPGWAGGPQQAASAL
jgi:hypothetical protein